MAQFVFKLNGQEVSEPVGWDEVSFNVIRSNQHGIDQPWTNSVTFTGDIDKEPGKENGARILRLAWENEFINASVDVEIIGDFKYQGEQWSFVGKIDFATYEEINICNGCSDGVSVSILQDDFRERFRQRAAVELDLKQETDLDGNPVDALTLRTVRLHSQELYIQADGQMFQDRVLTFTSPSEPVFPVFWQKSDFKGYFGSTFDTQGNFASNTNIIFQANGPGNRELQLSGRAYVAVKNKNPSNSYRAFVTATIFDSGGGTISFTTIFTTPFIAPGATYTIDHNFSIPVTVPEGCRLIYWLSLDFNAVGGWQTTFYKENTVRLVEISSAAASECDGLLIHEYLNRIAYLITGQPDRVLSDYFQAESGCMWNNLITSGLLIRNAELLDNQTLQIKATWDKTFENLNRIFCLGWEFEQNAYGDWFIRVEPTDYFYQQQIAANFTKVPEIKRYSLVEKLVNSIKSGYSDKWKNIAIQGAFEIHTDRQYFVDNRAMNKNSSSELDLRSDMVAAGTTIEFLRRLQFLKEDSASSDRPNDYDQFLIWLNPETLTFADIDGTGYALDGETGPATFGPGEASYSSDLIGTNNSPIDRLYNVLHTPVRVASRWWKWLGMNTFGLIAEKQQLRFTSGQYFTDFEMAVPDPCFELKTTALAENLSIGIDTLNDYNLSYLVQPIGYEITVPEEICDFLETARNGKQLIKFSCGSSVFAGYILKGENRPSGENGGLSTYTLIGSEIPVNLRTWGPQFGPQFS